MTSAITIYGTTEELEKRWRTLNSVEETRAESLIEDANYLLRQIATNNNIDLDEKISADTTGVYQRNVEVIILNAVQRELGTPVEAVPDATSWSQSATPYSEQMSFSAGNNSSLYFKNRELQLLGLGSVAGNAQISILRGARGVNDGLEIDS